jgi:hypothetical protein
MEMELRAYLWSYLVFLYHDNIYVHRNPFSLLRAPFPPFIFFYISLFFLFLFFFFGYQVENGLYHIGMPLISTIHDLSYGAELPVLA